MADRGWKIPYRPRRDNARRQVLLDGGRNASRASPQYAGGVALPDREAHDLRARTRNGTLRQTSSGPHQQGPGRRWLPLSDLDPRGRTEPAVPIAARRAGRQPESREQRKIEGGIPEMNPLKAPGLIRGSALDRKSTRLNS